jgi:hypothetical protein
MRWVPESEGGPEKEYKTDKYYHHLLRKKWSSPAVILAGFDEAGETNGLLVSCDEGRFILGIQSLGYFYDNWYPIGDDLLEHALEMRFDYLNK